MTFLDAEAVSIKETCLTLMGHRNNDMALDVLINTSESLLSSYHYYSKEVYDICMAALRKDFAENDAVTDDVLQRCIISMSHTGISHPKYR